MTGRAQARRRADTGQARPRARTIKWFWHRTGTGKAKDRRRTGTGQAHASRRPVSQVPATLVAAPTTGKTLHHVVDSLFENERFLELIVFCFSTVISVCMPL